MENFICNKFSKDSIFVQCECGGEIMEISTFGIDEGYIHFSLHSWFDRKKYKYCGFDLEIKDFLVLVDAINKVHPGIKFQFKNFDKEKCAPEILQVEIDSNFITFSLYDKLKNIKKGNVIWEVIIGEYNFINFYVQLNRIKCLIDSNSYNNS